MATVLFICTGNTCRSPMAECLFRSMDIHHKHRAISAGIRAVDGDRASVGARRAMERRGLSLENHRTKQVTREMLRDVNLVVGMSQNHIDILKEMFPNLRVQTFAFNPPVSDPYGGVEKDYERVAADLVERVRPLIPAIEVLW